MLIKDIIFTIEKVAPLRYQEGYDNSGLITGCMNNNVDAALICLDVTMLVIEEALEKGAGLIICHHPPVFEALKKFSGNSHTEKILTSAIKNNLAIYASHTSLDNTSEGINHVLSNMLGLKNLRVLMPLQGVLRKLVTFCPKTHIEKVREAVFSAGAGHIGAYDSCGYNLEGKGSFRPSAEANPFVGEKNKLHYEDEIRFETIYPVHLENAVIQALRVAHPYEEVAYDIYPLDNTYNLAGSGMIGEMDKPIDEVAFLNLIKRKLHLKHIKHSERTGREIKTVALCSGAGGFLINKAISAGADAYLSAEFKHNNYIDVKGRVLISDIGHFESEQYAKELIKSVLIKKFPNFAAIISEKEENPVYYL